jgi:hypothetical protein
MDITPSIPNPACRFGGELVPDKTLKMWKASNPKGYKHLFEERAKLAPVIRLRKHMARDSASESVEPYPEPGGFKGKLPRLRGKLPIAASIARLFMAGQAHSALGTAKIITGDVHQRKAIWRIDQTAPEGRYTMDDAGRISEMRDRGFAEAREQLPELRRHFFGTPADEFVPFYRL